MMIRERLASRNLELLLLLLVSLIAFLGFTIAEVTAQVEQGLGLFSFSLTQIWMPLLFLSLPLLVLHFLLRWRGLTGEQIILPLVGLLVTLGMIMIGRLRPQEAVWQQLTRGWLPGLIAILLLIGFPRLVEQVRRNWPVTISLLGLFLLMATAFIGVEDEAGARLALRIGPLPAIQTTELIKLSLIIFLAWYIESEGEAAERRARSFGWLRLPSIHYFIPGLLFVFLATLALVRMADYGAIFILAFLFIIMLYVGFESRIFMTVLAIGLTLSLLMGFVLLLFWDVPPVIQHRLVAFVNPWSQEPLLLNGEPTGLTIAQGPGYQIQQAIYALVDGEFLGTGIGQGTPQNVPLAHSDFIFASLAEELGLAGAMAILACFAVLLLRILRVAVLLPPRQVFERLLVVGIAAHLLAQLFIMVGGTVNLLPVTGVTVPFLSQGGMALLVNLVEIGFVLTLTQRLKQGQP